MKTLLKKIHRKNILNLILNDEQSGNSLSELMIEELHNALIGAEDNTEIKVIIISSVGKIFSSGHNLKEISEARDSIDKGEDYFMKLFKSCSSLMQAIVNCNVPIIAKIDGVATAAGCQLVASCDLAIASESSKFATPGVNLGLFCSTPMVALSRNVKKKDAMKMLLTGEMIDAKEAKRIGLINDHVPRKHLKNVVEDLAEVISKKSPSTVKIGKEAFYKQHELSLSDAYEYTSIVMTRNILDDDAIEGIESFLEKRKPNWKDT